MLSTLCRRTTGRFQCRHFGGTAKPTQLITPSIKVADIQKKLFIDGEFVDSVTGMTLPTIDPRNEEVITEFAAAQSQDIDLAVSAARKAFDEGPYTRMSGFERSKLLWRLADRIEAKMDHYQTLESWDNGKPKDQSWVDVTLTVEHLRYFAGWADKIHGKVMPMNNTFGNFEAKTYHEPIGVVACIIPWNFPLLMCAWKLAPSLAMGCTNVVKSAESTPLTALELARDIADVGFPKGVVNMVPGIGETAGARLAAHPNVDKVAFTGEVATGRLIMQAAAQNLNSVSLELGGKSPLVIAEDADLEKAVADMGLAMFFNAGQVCCAASRIFVHDSVYDEFAEKVVAQTKQRVVGDPFVEGTSQGPQQNEQQFLKVLDYIELGKASGKAKLLCGGQRIGDKGYFVESTVFGDVDDDAVISREEIFGPVMQLTRYGDLDEAIRRANDSEFGLAAGIYSKDIDKVNRFTREVRAGTVWVNCYNNFEAPLPFGGYKKSGFGREKGEYALQTFTEVKAVCTAMPEYKGPY